MTNEQLYFQMKQFRDRLALELEKTIALMPETAEREMVRRHNVEGCRAYNTFVNICMDSSHYETVADGGHIALLPISNWLSDIDEDLELLHMSIKRENQTVESAV